MCKVQPPTAAGRPVHQGRFGIDLDARTVTCPAGQTAPICAGQRRRRWPYFGRPARPARWPRSAPPPRAGARSTSAPYEEQLAPARARQRDPGWAADYRATRPKVERKIAHLMRRRHGGRRARVRGQVKVAADFALLAAAVNLARLGVLGLARNGGTWVADTS